MAFWRAYARWEQFIDALLERLTALSKAVTFNGGVTVDTGDLEFSNGANIALGTGIVGGTVTAETLGAGATTFAATGRAMEITGDGGGNTVATITGGTAGQFLLLVFVDANVTITDTDAHTANTVDLSAAFVSADDTTLLLFFDGTSWYEVSRSVN